MKQNNQIVITVTIAGAILTSVMFYAVGLDAALLWVKEYIYWPLLHKGESILRNAILTPVFITAFTVILILERLYPVNPQQKMFSVGFMHDSVWLVLGLLFEGVFVAGYTNALKGFYESHLNFLTVAAIGGLPEAVRLIWGILLTDFLAWFQHWVKHKVPWLWHIHAIHHSQKEINMFTDLRFHFLEYIISRTIVVVPLLMLAIDTPKIAAFAVFNTWYTRLYHANIKTNLGFLRYILVTPQSHRVHHSVEFRHRDKNFGVIFSFWDRIFKTQHENYEEYPETGIDDNTFPLEKESSILSLIMVPVQQLLYPFRVMAQDLLRKKADDDTAS